MFRIFLKYYYNIWHKYRVYRILLRRKIIHIRAAIGTYRLFHQKRKTVTVYIPTDYKTISDWEQDLSNPKYQDVLVACIVEPKSYQEDKDAWTIGKHRFIPVSVSEDIK